MKFISAALALAGLVAAQEIQSKPFTLKLSSEDKKWDGKGVSSCHVGAAFESLCIGDHSELFHFNTTTGAQPAAEGYTPAGVLAWTLPTSMYCLSSARSAIQNHARYSAFDRRI